MAIPRSSFQYRNRISVLVFGEVYAPRRESGVACQSTSDAIAPNHLCLEKYFNTLLSPLLFLPLDS